MRSFCSDLHSVQTDALSAFARWAQFVYRPDNSCLNHSYSNRVELHSSIVPQPGDSKFIYPSFV